MTEGPISSVVRRGDVLLQVTDAGGSGTPVLLLHGLAGSSRELLPTAAALTDLCHVLLMDQRGHGGSTRRPADVSRRAFVDDVTAVLETLVPAEPAVLVGQSMGAHTAFMVAHDRPDLVAALVMLEGHVAGDPDPGAAAGLGRWFASWPVPFPTQAAAREFLGDDPIVEAWLADMERTEAGLVPRFDPRVMAACLAAVHEPRWREWEELVPPTLAVFAKDGMFAADAKTELISRRPQTARVDLASGSHDAHLDAFDEWVGVLRGWLPCGLGPSSAES